MKKLMTLSMFGYRLPAKLMVKQNILTALIITLSTEQKLASTEITSEFKCQQSIRNLKSLLKTSFDNLSLTLYLRFLRIFLLFKTILSNSVKSYQFLMPKRSPLQKNL